MPQPETPTARATEESRPVTEPTDLTALRAAARARIGVPGDAPVRWRYVTIEYVGAIAPVCTASSYTGSSETYATHTLDDGSRDDTGLYDCCPYPHIEVWSDELAAYLVALLNADAATVGNDGDEEITCARLHCPARVWFRHAEVRGWHPLPTGSWYCPDEHVPGDRGGE